MPVSMQESMDKARKAYHDQMTAVQKYEQHELYKLQEYKMEAEKYLKDEINRRFANINNIVNTAKRTATDNQNKVSDDIMRGFQKNKSANANIPRENTYPRYIPPRETPRHYQEQPYVAPPRGVPFTPPPRETPLYNREERHIPHLKTNIDFKEAYETTERGYYYRVLGLAPGSSQQEVRKAYGQKMLIYHPDKSRSRAYNPKNSAYMIKVVSQAKKILGDINYTEEKEKYDEEGNAKNWIKDIKGALKNKCYNLSGYNPYIVLQ